MNEYWIEQSIIYNSYFYSSLNCNKLSFQRCTYNFKHAYWNKVNKLKPTSLLLRQPLSEPASFVEATMWMAGTPSDGMCYHNHTLPSLPDVLHTQPVVTHITPFRKGHLAMLPSLAIFPASTIFVNGVYRLGLLPCETLDQHIPNSLSVDCHPPAHYIPSRLKPERSSPKF